MLQHRKAGSHGVPTKSMQYRRALRKTFDQVKTLDAPRGTAPLLTFGVNDEGRTVELFHQPPRRQPEHAERPAVLAHDDHRRAIRAPGRPDPSLPHNLRP